ncbi:MAG: hypothetical protein ACYTHJ_12465 [Planctomycetota bacterium]|jgi:hypothetical protein
MTLTVDQQEILEAFVEFVEGECGVDDRYGTATRYGAMDGDHLGTRFSLGPNCWLDVCVKFDRPQVCVGFVTDDQMIRDDLLGLIEEFEDTPSGMLERALDEAGMPWENPQVDQGLFEDKYHTFSTSLDLEVVDDVDLDHLKIRSKVQRMLEAYMIAFGSAIAMEEEEE